MIPRERKQLRDLAQRWKEDALKLRQQMLHRFDPAAQHVEGRAVGLEESARQLEAVLRGHGWENEP